MEPKTAIKLGYPVKVLGLQCGKRVDARWTYLAEGLDSFYRAEPVECEEGFIGANLQQDPIGRVAVPAACGKQGRMEASLPP